MRFSWSTDSSTVATVPSVDMLTSPSPTTKQGTGSIAEVARQSEVARQAVVARQSKTEIS